MDDRAAYRLPSVVTHNYDPDRGPFRNLCSLSDGDAQTVLAAIGAEGHRSIKPNYLARRRAAEAWLLSERTRKLGAPKLRHPIYFFLGDMSDGADPSRPRSYVVPLASLPADAITFTYPDSMASHLIGFRDDLAHERLPHHGKLFTLAEIADLIAREGLPGKRWQVETGRRHDRFIEMQLWEPVPLAALNQPVNQFKINP